MDDFDLFLSTPAQFALPSTLPGIDLNSYPLLSHPAQSLVPDLMPLTALSNSVKQKAFPGYAFTERPPEAQAAYAVAAMQAERIQRDMDSETTTRPYW